MSARGMGLMKATSKRASSERAEAAKSTQVLTQLLADGTAALAHLDAESLELLQVRAMQLGVQMDGQRHTLHEDEAEHRRLTSQHRIFADVLRSTQEQLNLLKRMNGRGMGHPWDR